MSSLTFLTSELQALSKEAGRKHGDVKEAADKALALLKSSPDSALSDLHNAESATGTPAKYPILLAPIVYGCSTKNPKVTSIAVSGLQRLTGVRGAITQNNVPVILTTLRSVLSQGVEIQLKILQTLVSLLTNCKDVHGDLLAETLLISFKLLESKIGVVSSTAAATLRQLVMFVFENVDEEDKFYRRSKEDTSIPGPIPTEFSVPLPSPSPADPDSKKPHYLLPAARDAYLVFDDICLLINGEQPSFLKLQNLPRTFGLELIESVLSDFSNVFIGHPELLHLLRTLLSPLLIRALAEKPSFSTTLRLMRVMYLLLKKFNDHLVMESEIFLCMFVKIVAPGDTEGSGGHPLSSSMLPTLAKDGKSGALPSGNNGSSPPWMRVLALEILRGLCGDFELLSKIWLRYDSAGGAQPEKSTTSATNSASTSATTTSKVPVFRSMITALNKLATEKPALLGTGTAVIAGVVADPQTGEYSVSGVVDGIVGMAQQAATSVGVSGLTQGALALSTASVKLQCIDQLDKTDAPLIPETYVFLLALQCLNAIAEGFAASTLSLYSNIMNKRPRNGQEPLSAPLALDLEDPNVGEDPAYRVLRTSRDMADAAWPALLASLSFYLSTNLDDDLFSYTLSAFQQFNTTCGVLALNTPRDAFLISLCKFAVPPPIISNLAAADASSTSGSSRPPLNSVLSAGADALGLSSQHVQPMSLSTRNLLCLRSLIHVAQALAGSLEKTWFYVFEALQNADLVVRTEAARRQKKRTFPHASVTPASPSKGSGSSHHHNGTHGASTSSSGTSPYSAAGPRFVPTDQEEQAAQSRATRLFEASKALDDNAFWWFLTALCRLNGEMIGISLTELGESSKWTSTPGVLSPRKLDSDFGEEGIITPKQPKRSGINVIRTLRPGERSYAITKLGDVSVMNMDRMTSQTSSAVAWEVVIDHLLLVQHWQQAPTIVRMQAAEIFDKIVSLAPREVASGTTDEQRKVQTHVLEALSKQSKPQGKAQQSTDIDIRQAGLETLFRLLESQGHTLSCGWTLVFEILKSACPEEFAAGAGDESGIPPTSTAKASQLVRVAFSSLQLICSDFLAGLSIAETDLCIAALTAFGRQVEDVNIALTAGNLLWQVSDHLQAARRQSDVPQEYVTLWMTLLYGLLRLCRDKRQEARDGAIQILWRSIELYAATLDEETWNKCLWDVIVPLLDCLDEDLRAVEQDPDAAAGEKTSLGVPLAYKQWDDSKLLALASVGSVFSSELPNTISALDSFERVCQQLVKYCKKSFVHDRASVATAAAKALEKIASAQWQKDKKDKAEYLASTIWTAWVDIGEDLRNTSQVGLTQQNLESYSRIMAKLQDNGYINFDHDLCCTLLAILKNVITYSRSPDYRPDQDVMPPLQATVMAIVDKISLLSSKIASDVLSDLAEYMTLAYTATASQSMSPVLSQPPKRNQAVTYIALSKYCDNKILEVYEHFHLDTDIYLTAVEKILAAYSIPLKLKYDCPSPSRFGDDPPLWKTATAHFLRIAKSIVGALNTVCAELDVDVSKRLWKRLIGAFEAVLLADCRAVLDMPPDEQRMEEDFDLAVIVTLELDILPTLGEARVPTEAITSLAKALRQASSVYELNHENMSNDLASPSLTAVDSNEERAAKDVRFSCNYDAQASATTLIDGTTIEDTVVARERFAFWSFDLLFTMCKKSDSAGKQRQALVAFPLFFHRCLAVLRLYLADSSVRGRVPFSRIREEELAFVLLRLSELRLNEGLFEAAFDPVDPFKALQEVQGGQRPLDPAAPASHVLKTASRRSSRAHLHETFDELLALLSSERLQSGRASATVPYASLSFSGQDADRTARMNWSLASPFELARRCLELVGQDFKRA